jgi:hypothetical protein
MLTVLRASGLPTCFSPGPSSHESFHAHGGQESMVVTECSGQKPPQRRRDLPWSDRTVDQVDQDIRSGRCTAELSRTWNQGDGASHRRTRAGRAALGPTRRGAASGSL